MTTNFKFTTSATLAMKAMRDAFPGDATITILVYDPSTQSMEIASTLENNRRLADFLASAAQYIQSTSPQNHSLIIHPQ